MRPPHNDVINNVSAFAESSVPMAVNPTLGQTPVGVAPAPFPGEEFLLHRDFIDLQVDGLRCVFAHLAGTVTTTDLLFRRRCGLGLPDTVTLRRGRIYLSDVRLVFVAAQPHGPLAAFDVPLLYVRNEAFVQPIFGANYISLHCLNVALGPDHAPHYVSLAFKEGGAGTFLEMWSNVLSLARGAHASRQSHIDAGAAEIELRELRTSALIDPADPSTVFLPVDSNGESGSFQCDAAATEPERYPGTGLRRRYAATVRAVED
jgi:hypothetical protein